MCSYILFYIHVYLFYFKYLYLFDVPISIGYNVREIPRIALFYPYNLNKKCFFYDYTNIVLSY